MSRSLAASLLLAVALAGCGGGGSDDGGATPDQTLTVTVGGSGSGTVTSSPAGISCSSGTCTASFPQGTQVTLTEAPAGDSLFTGWSGACGGTGSCSVTLSGDTTVNATFALAVTLTVDVSGNGSGTVTSSPAGISCTSGTCTASFPQGAAVALYAAPGGSSAFGGWSGACSGTGSCDVTMSAAVSVGASFVPSYPLSVTLAGSGSGTVTSSPAGISCTSGTCSHSFADGTSVTLSAAPGGGSAFGGWSGDCTGTGACIVTVNAARNVTASFAPVYQVAVATSGDGSGTVTSSPAGISCTSGSSAGCTASFASGTSVTLTAAPDASSSFPGWSDPCFGSQAPCTFTVSNNTNVTATFSGWVVRRPFPTWVGGAVQLGSTLVAVGLGSAYVTSADGLAWTGHPFAAAPSLRGIAVSTGATPTAVAVGDAGAVVTTTDPSAWTARTSGTSSDLRAVAYGASTFVAVGRGGTVLYSGDGAAWSAATSGTAYDLLAVTYADGKFVATGYGGTVLTSTDGQGWTSRNSGTAQYLTGVAHDAAAGGFVAVGSGGAIITSANGTAWTAQTSPTTSLLTGVAALSGTYVAVDGNQTAYSSTNGTSWATHTLPGDSISGVAAAGSAFHVLGSLGSLMRSTDGIAFSLVLAPTGSGPASAQIYGAAFGSSAYVVVGSWGAIFSSPDGVVWTSRRAGTDNVHSVAYGNGAFVAVTTSEILRSTDGAAWTHVAAAPDPNGGLVAYGAGAGMGFVVVSGNNTASGISTSADGLTWTTQAGAGITTRQYGIACGDTCAAVGYGTIYTNASPATTPAWTPQSVPSGFTVLWPHAIAWGNGTFVASAGGFNNDTYTSANGMSWSAAHPNSAYVGNVYFGNGQFMGMGFQTSSDGVTWTQMTRPPGQTGLDAAAYGTAGWVAARSFFTTSLSEGSLAFLVHQ